MSESDRSLATVVTPGALPRISAEVRTDGTGFLIVDGVREDVVGEDIAEVGGQITTRIAHLAAGVGEALTAQVRDPDGMWMLLVYPDGRVDEAPPPGTPSMPVPQIPTLDPLGAATPSGATAVYSGETPVYSETIYSSPDFAEAVYTEPAYTEPVYETGPVVVEPTMHTGGTAYVPTLSAPTPTVPTTAPSDENSDLGELLASRRKDRRDPVATWGARARLHKMTFGAVKPRPGAREQEHLDAIASIQRPLDGPRTVVVINPKGGAHKTTATLMLAATFGTQRGGYTLAWDNNETHGTLGWRSATPVGGTAMDLLRSLPSLTQTRQLRLGDLDGFVRTQTAAQFDVLASDEDAASAAYMDAESFRSLHTVLSRFYRVMVVDTGNNIRASNWRAAIEAADQLVIVSTVREDTAQAAAWAIDAMRAAGLTNKVRQAVTVLSRPESKMDKDLRARLHKHFGVLTRAVVEVPYDPVLVAGGPISYGELREDTRQAWIAATAAVAEGL